MFTLTVTLPLKAGPYALLLCSPYSFSTSRLLVRQLPLSQPWPQAFLQAGWVPFMTGGLLKQSLAPGRLVVEMFLPSGPSQQTKLQSVCVCVHVHVHAYVRKYACLCTHACVYFYIYILKKVC